MGNVTVLTAERIHHNVITQAVRGQGGDKSPGVQKERTNSN